MAAHFTEYDPQMRYHISTQISPICLFMAYFMATWAVRLSLTIKIRGCAWVYRRNVEIYRTSTKIRMGRSRIRQAQAAP